MKNRRIAHIFQSAILIGLAVVSQLLIKIVPHTEILGLNLNALLPAIFIAFILVISACCFNFIVSTTVAVLTPIVIFVVSLSQTSIPATILTDIVSNFFLIFYIWICVRASKGLKNVAANALEIVGVFTGACLKMLVANVLTEKIIVSFLEVSKKGADQIYSTLSNELFIATLIGGLLALLITPVIKRAFNTK